MDAERQYLMIEAERRRNATIIKANGTAEMIEIAIEQFLARDPTLTNATQAYLMQLYLQALTNPDSNIECIIVTEGGVSVIVQPRG